MSFILALYLFEYIYPKKFIGYHSHFSMLFEIEYCLGTDVNRRRLEDLMDHQIMRNKSIVTSRS